MKVERSRDLQVQRIDREKGNRPRVVDLLPDNARSGSIAILPDDKVYIQQGIRWIDLTASGSAEVEELRETVEDLQNTVTTNTQNINSVETRVTTVRRDLDDLIRQIQGIDPNDLVTQNDIDDIENDIRRIENDIDALERRVRDLEI